LLHISDMEIYRSELESLLAQYAHEPIELMIVPDIAEWTRGRKGNFSGNPPGMAIRDAETEAAAILLRRNITQEAAESIVDRVCLGGHPNVRRRLVSGSALAKHLVLHELAHLENDWSQDMEDACDAWAFERM
jgi:hypothetical protein